MSCCLESLDSLKCQAHYGTTISYSCVTLAALFYLLSTTVVIVIVVVFTVVNDIIITLFGP